MRMKTRLSKSPSSLSWRQRMRVKETEKTGSRKQKRYEQTMSQLENAKRELRFYQFQY